MVVTAATAAAIAVTLGLFFVAENDLKHANHATARAADVTSASLILRSEVTSLDRAFSSLIRFRSTLAVADWNRARVAWRPAYTQLVKKVQTPEQRQQTREIGGEIRSYISDYAGNILKLSRFAPETARSSAVAQEGKFRLGSITRQLDLLAATATGAATNRSNHADSFARRATAAGLVALIVAPLLLFVAGFWLMRGVARPLRAAVDAASSVAGGDFSVRLDDARQDEFGVLARAFNRMTAALRTSHDELVERAQRLAESEQRKSELISIVSHEVRTPLASILGFARLLLGRDIDPDEQRHYLGIIDEEATRLASLVSDFLDVRLLEDESFPLQSSRFDLRHVVVEQVERTIGRDPTVRVELLVDDQPVIVFGDEQRMTQVVVNLLSNAAKFSPDGGRVTVGLQAASHSIRVFVEDQGPGIPAEHAERLFEPFFRGSAPAAGIPGSGIGLALSRRIVEAHGGRIGFENLRRGTRFWFELPPLTDEAPTEPSDPVALADS
jgi:signal transduction histidine kinase